jgi:SagB-type dehydrogenase family enzyme
VVQQDLLKTTRRIFLRMLGGAVALASKAGAARPTALAPQIHVATRNTRFGAVGRRTPRSGSGFKRYPDATWIGLPTAKSSGGSLDDVLNGSAQANPFSTAEFTAAELSALLFHTNGVTGRYPIGEKFVPLRAAPSAGANYAGEVYVVVERVRGVPPGLYYYGVGRHRLIRLRQGSLIGRVGSALEQRDDNAVIAVMLTNVFGRYTSHYANRGYRYALIDSGHIGENLRLSARSLDMAAVSPLRFWDDQLNELLQIDGRTEAVCAVHLIGREGRDAGRKTNHATRFSEFQDSVGPVESGSAIERFHQATKLVPSTPMVRSAGVSSDLANAGGVDLPSPEPMTIRVQDAIRERRSAEGFDARSITLGHLSSVLRAAGGNTANTRATDVEVFTVAHRVARLEPGVYRYAGEAHQLIPVRSGAFANEMVAACLRQEMAGRAAAGLVMATRLDVGTSELGNRRYRDMLVESGAIAQRIYLAAEGLGLGARNLAAFVDDRFNELLRLDRYHRFALHLTMLGHVRRD